ncbi:response regulator [Tundrisphaera lichenicola]|uniref:response regulator n=1 Tax=Tundrisphaera lichenicola TaxID=2029860 RepID=UPI003EBB3EBA
MLVEDDPSSRNALRIILSRLGLEVLHAGTLTDASRLLRNRPDYLVLDLMLPDGDGVKLLEEIRNLDLPIRIAVTTGTIDRSRIESVRSFNPDVLLFKPISLYDLIRGLNLRVDATSRGVPSSL